MSSAVPLTPSGPGRVKLSRLVCSMANRSTCGVKAIFGGKWPWMPMAATKPGPRIRERRVLIGGKERSDDDGIGNAVLQGAGKKAKPAGIGAAVQKLLVIVLDQVLAIFAAAKNTTGNEDPADAHG